MKYVKINQRKIGEDYPPYIVAEISANHNGELKKAFDEGGLAANYAQYAYIIALMTGSFVVVLLINTLWNRLIPRITNWRKIDYFEAMGIMTIILLLSYI